jgi:LytS/YehU family sensor histidine kinase
VNVDRLVRDRGRLFWILNIAGWTGYALAAWLGALAHEKPEAYFAVIFASSAVGLIITVFLRLIYRDLWNRSLWVLFYILLCWSGLYFGIKYYLQLQEQTQQTLAATSAAHQAQLKMLRYQLNPHFLFNTLNAISTLILDGKNETANQAVSRLSDFLRYTLDNDPMSRVTLGAELAANDLYLEIEKVRFGDRLIIEKSIEAKAQEGLVPSLILQPLIENAIKYAITPSESGGALRISARVQQKTLVLQLADTGPGLGNGNNGQKSCGVGLKNTRERLQQLYGDNQAFTLAPNEPSGLRITINIPYEVEDD